MSMHEIEALIEDSTHSINQSKKRKKNKRNLLVNIYSLMGMFDCSYTHFRCIDVLLKNEMTYRMPLAAHPDYATNKEAFDSLIAKGKYWLPAYMDEPDEGSVYYQKDDGQIYFDAGSVFWQRLTDLGQDFGEKPEQWPFERTIKDMLDFLVREDNKTLYSEWLALVVNSVDYFELGDFHSFSRNKDIKQVRYYTTTYPEMLVQDAGYSATSFEYIDENLEYFSEDEVNKINFILGREVEKTEKPKVNPNYNVKDLALVIHKKLLEAGWSLEEQTIENDSIEQVYFWRLKQEPTSKEKVLLSFLHLYFDPERQFFVPQIEFKYGYMIKWQQPKNWDEGVALGRDVSFNLYWESDLDVDQLKNDEKDKTIADFNWCNEQHLGNAIDRMLPNIPKAKEDLESKYSVQWFENYCSSSPFLDEDEYDPEIQSKFKKLPGRLLVRWHMVLLKAFWHYEQKEIKEAKYWAQEFLKYIAPVEGQMDMAAYKTSAESILNDEPKLCKLY